MDDIFVLDIMREDMEDDDPRLQSVIERYGVSLNTIRAYERKSKDLHKAQLQIVIRLAKALKCEISELLE